MKLEPQTIYVACKVPEKKSPIILIEQKTRPTEAIVLAVGPGGYHDGQEVKMAVEPGDRIIFDHYSALELQVEGEKVYFVIMPKVVAKLK